MKPIRKTRHAVMFMGAGAVAAYFLDPDSGPERRARMLEQVQSLTGQVGSSSGGSSDSEEQAGSPSPSSSSSAAEPFAASATSSSDSSDESDESERGPIDLATGEPLSGSSTSPGV